VVDEWRDDVDGGGDSGGEYLERGANCSIEIFQPTIDEY
jgi:hypothetical protein